MRRDVHRQAYIAIEKVQETYLIKHLLSGGGSIAYAFVEYNQHRLIRGLVFWTFTMRRLPVMLSFFFRVVWQKGRS